MVKVLQAARAGGPEVLEYVDVEVADPGPGEIRLRHGAIGVNYIDTYHRAGTYPGSGFPRILGVEGAGEVTAVGEGVTTVKPGDRVCYPLGPGAYCEERVINAGVVVPVPDGISDEQAAAAITKGITVHHLYTRVRQVGAGDWVLFHAAAGGVGLFACQWAKHIGAKLIGTVSSDAKAKLARDNGAVETIDYTKEDFVERVKDITGGDGVALAVDGIGGDNPTKSAQCLAAYGTLTTIGQASGPTTMTIDDLPPSVLYTKGSIATLLGRLDELAESAAAFFDLVQKGAINIAVNHTYALKDGAQAHTDLQARKTTGSIILKP
ncbi:MAG: quinone oxidoreductase [Alphaproteobacteria bacterium]